MIIIKHGKKLAEILLESKKKQKKIGFVPTMGALHQGHLSLVNNSIERNNITVCSIFINPTQFNDPEDFKKYPVTIEKDISMLESAGCHILFLPSVNEIYPDGIFNLKRYELGYLETVLEGEYRPGHFQGVCQVVHRLLEIVSPDFLFLGQKDYQQCLVIKKLLELTGLRELINLIIVPTIRENDGLAMSSRNKRLNIEARNSAPAISKSLLFVKENLLPGKTSDIIEEATRQLISTGFRVDYIEIADASTLELIKVWDGKLKVVALTAAFINDVRLIDNLLIN